MSLLHIYPLLLYCVIFIRVFVFVFVFATNLEVRDCWRGHSSTFIFFWDRKKQCLSVVHNYQIDYEKSISTKYFIILYVKNFKIRSHTLWIMYFHGEKYEKWILKFVWQGSSLQVFEVCILKFVWQWAFITACNFSEDFI